MPPFVGTRWCGRHWLRHSGAATHFTREVPPMPSALGRWFLLLCTTALCWALMAAPAAAAPGRLVDATWLQANRADVVLLDASVTPQHLAGHIPGAVSADLYRYGVNQPTRAAMEQRIQSWGLSAGRKVVVYDQGADMMATRLFFDLYYNGVPAEDIFLLDGGLAQWKAQGGAVTQAPTPPPAPGSFRITAVREQARVRFAEFFAASGDRTNHALVEALEPAYHYGAQKFFDRAGHVPGAILMPSADFFNADKTFKSPDEIRRMVRYLGIRPEQTVHSHCGGGVAASVPWFALQFMAGHAATKIYLESQREWLQDDRGLPYWTYSAQQIQRQSAWLDGWNAPMLRAFGVVQLNVVDVRAADKYALGHVAFALNLPADTFRSHLGRPQELASLLGAAGVNPAHEVVLMAESGLTPGAALAFLAFEQLGQKKVSVLMDSVDEWGLRGYALTKAPTLVGPPKTPQDITVPAASYPAQPREGVLVRDPDARPGLYPKVFVASGKTAPSRTPAGTVVQLPYTDLLNADGTPKAAAELWKRFTAAGVPRYAEVIVFADDPAEAAVNYYLLRLMGWPDVKVWVN
jgi:thiosulfate/3-mercaptopyruvate sulfurtransferase